MRTYKVKNLDIELTEEQLDDLIKQRENKGERFFFPKDGEKYFNLAGAGVDMDNNDNAISDINRISRGAFRTEAQAKKEDEKRLALVKMWKWVQENGLYWEPNWESVLQDKYYPLYDYNSKEWENRVSCSQYRANFLFPHFKTPEDCQKFIDNNLLDLNLFI